MEQFAAWRKVSAQGNAKTIAILMNQLLQPQGVNVKVKSKDNRLKILLESAQVPDQQQLVPVVVRGLAKLELIPEGTVCIYGRRVGARTLAWAEAVPPEHWPGGQHPHYRSTTIPKLRLLDPLDPVDAIVANDSSSSNEAVLIDQVRQALSQMIDIGEIVTDIELEGSDLLITLETPRMLHSKALMKPIKQGLATLNLGTVQVVRLYKRNPKTQRVLPLQEIVLATLSGLPANPDASVATGGSVLLNTPERDFRQPSQPPWIRQGRHQRDYHWLLLGLIGLLGGISWQIWHPLTLSQLAGSRFWGTLLLLAVFGWGCTLLISGFQTLKCKL
jgi:hypothetical protein